jgi:protein-L-isoaspartate(D-aspartate) O-methyltransferase
MAIPMEPLHDDPDQRARRHAMVDAQLRGRDIRDPRVLHAFSVVPRHLFVPSHLREMAYDDCPLPIGQGQTISQPLMVALMLEALELEGTERVLDIGTGSGYAAALLAELAAEVITVEVIDALVHLARANLARAGYAHVQVVHSDGSLGHAPAAPYDAIVVAAGSPDVPPALLEQLADGGRLVVPVGSRHGQSCLRLRRDGAVIHRDDLGACAFVPLVGAQGWHEPPG